MMTITLRIALILVSLGTFAMIMRKIRQSRMQIESAIFWIVLALVLVGYSVFPKVADACASLLGIYATTNFLFLFAIFVLILKVFFMSIHISQLESKIKDASAKTKDVPYAATESVAWYLADDLGMKDATPTGYAQASANESEPTPSDIKAFQDALKGGSIKMLVFNTQEANSTTDQITGAAKSANVPIVELTEQMPKEYTNLLDWMSALVDQFAKA